MSLDRLVEKLKGGAGSGNFGHSGRPGKKGGSRASMFTRSTINNPRSAKELGNQLKRNVDAAQAKAREFAKQEGLPVPQFRTPEQYYVPGFHDGRNIRMSSLPDDHRKSLRNDRSLDEARRFGLRYDSSLSRIREVTFVTGAQGVDWNDPKFEDKALKRIYQTMDSLKGFVPRGTPVSIELMDLDERTGYPKEIRTSI